MHRHDNDSGRTTTVGLLVSLCINAVIALAELIAGTLAGSVALVADSTHNFGDVFALAVACLARRLGSRPPTLRHTYGLKRIEVIAAVWSASVLICVAILIVRQALARLLHPEPYQTGITIAVASVAVVANGVSALLLRHHDPQDLNVRSAFLHLAQDAVSSLLVVVSALVTTRTRLGSSFDSIAALVIAVAVVIGAVSVLRQALATLLEAVPEGIQVHSLVQHLEQKFNDVAMHHVHVWQIGPKQRVLTAHLLVHNMDVVQSEILCQKVRAYLKDEWQIQHVTLEAEVYGCGSDTVLGTWSPVLEAPD
ncbi:MAG TPA: cation diffusion facilitator family transporter [Candidatus Sulfotelmatobacter sp.]|nr:cation diffusion facilitator family transporter [Candidatus Sulfotelmatobacter sp.]